MLGKDFNFFVGLLEKINGTGARVSRSTERRFVFHFICSCFSSFSSSDVPIRLYTEELRFLRFISLRSMERRRLLSSFRDAPPRPAGKDMLDT